MDREGPVKGLMHSYVKCTYESGKELNNQITVFMVSSTDAKHMVEAVKKVVGSEKLKQLEASVMGPQLWELLMDLVRKTDEARNLKAQLKTECEQFEQALASLGENRDFWVKKHDKVQKEAVGLEMSEANKIKEIKSLDHVVSVQRAELNDLHTKIDERDHEIESLESQLTDQSDQVDDLESQLTDQSDQVDDLYEQISDQDEVIDDLRSRNSQLISATLERDHLKAERDRLLEVLDEMESKVQDERHAAGMALVANSNLIQETAQHLKAKESALVRADCLEVQLKELSQEKQDYECKYAEERVQREDLTNKVFKVRLAAIIGHVIVGATSAYYPQVWAFVCKYGQPVVDYVYTMGTTAIF